MTVDVFKASNVIGQSFVGDASAMTNRSIDASDGHLRIGNLDIKPRFVNLGSKGSYLNQNHISGKRPGLPRNSPSAKFLVRYCNTNTTQSFASWYCLFLKLNSFQLWCS